jgi:NitT/TauT family transport system ATP-binding protein
MSFLKIDKVHHTYFTKTSATTALSDVNMQLEEGEFISFLGPSGCGKTTLLSIIAGLILPTEGRVFLNQKSVNEANRQIGYMLQQDYLFPWKTIEENILLGLKLSNSLTNETREYAFQLLEKMGLGHVKAQAPKQLSGGMRQRVALVRTLATEPKVLLLDEPFSALDYQTKLKLEDLVSTTLKSFGKTAILVTHDIGEAIAMSDRVYLFAANPGHIHKVFDIPEALRRITPFEARNHEEYSQVFQTIWKELESLE